MSTRIDPGSAAIRGVVVLLAVAATLLVPHADATVFTLAAIGTVFAVVTPNRIGALVVLLADLTGRLPHGTFAIAHTGPVVIGAAVLAGLVLFLAPRHGTVAGFAVVGAGVGALVYAWPERADDDPALGTRQVWDRPTSRTAAAWTAAWVAGCLWELTMFLLGGTEHDGRELYPAASDLLDPLLDHPLGLHSVPERGSVFHLTVPQVRPGRVAASAGPPGNWSSMSGRALLLDNEPAALVALDSLLTGWGWTVHAARHAQDALAAPWRPDVQIIDYHLDAGRTGTEAWAVLRARHGDVPTLFLTADRDNELRQRLLELGVLVLYKPLKPLALRQVLQRMHGMRPAVGSGPERPLREGESSVGGA